MSDIKLKLNVVNYNLIFSKNVRKFISERKRVLYSEKLAGIDFCLF